MPDEEYAAFGADSQECLLVVAGYADIAPVLKTVTAETAARVIASPELGDYFELRFADLGRRPDPGSGHAEAVARIADELTQPRGTAGRNFFALVTADRSATAAADLLAACGAHPVIAQLPIRCRGLASIDDRNTKRAGDHEPQRGALPDAKIVIPLGGGGWDQPGLVRELRHYAAEVHEDFAAGNQPGVTLDQLSRIRFGAAEVVPDSPAAEDTDRLAEDLATGDQAAEHRDPGAGPDLPTDALAPPPDALAPRTAVPVPPVEPSPGASPGPQPASGPARVGVMARRLLTLPRWRGQVTTAPDTADPAPTAGRQAFPVLAYLVLLIDEGTDDRASWRRGRSVLFEMDKALAGDAPGVYTVRALSAGDGAMGAPRPAGQLKRGDLGPPSSSLDFPRLLGVVRSTIQRDRTLRADGPAPAKPVIVFFAVDIPLADAVTAELHSELARDARVTWIVPEGQADLVSPGFVADGGWLFTDHQAIVTEVISFIRGAGAAGDHATTGAERSAG